MNTELEPQVPEVRGIKRYQVSGRQIVASQVTQYLDILKIFMGRILSDIQRHQIDETKKGLLKQKFREIIMKRVDYSKPAKLVQVLRDLRLPEVYGESLVIYEAGSRFGGGQFYRTTTAGAKASWFEKILGKNADAFKKYAPRVAIVAILAGAASFFLYQIIKKVRLSNQTWQVIETDIHPVVFELMDLIVDGRINSQVQVNEILSQTEEAIVKKYNLEAVR